MVWVRSEYAGELAVLSTWLSALVPWNVHHGAVGEGAVTYLRFPLFEVRYAAGLPVESPVAVADPLSAYLTQAGTSVGPAYLAWVAGAAVYLAALVASVAYYRGEERAASWPVHPVPLLGGLLAATGTVLGAAWLLLGRGLPGLSLPVGVVVYLAFGAVLLRADRVGAAGADAESEPESPD